MIQIVVGVIGVVLVLMLVRMKARRENRLRYRKNHVEHDPRRPKRTGRGGRYYARRVSTRSGHVPRQGLHTKDHINCGPCQAALAKQLGVSVSDLKDPLGKKKR